MAVAAVAATSKKAKVERLAESFLEYADDPVGFARDFLGIELWEPLQRASTALVTTHRVSIRSGHGCGKTHWLACLIIWAVCCRPEVEGVVTAPTFKQLTDVVFRRIESILSKSILKDFVAWRATSLKFGRNYISARTARKGEGLQGVHADYKIGTVLIIIEEASGVPETFFDSLEGAMSTGEAFIVMVGNPTQLQGKFHASHNAEREDWYTDRLNGEESPYRNDKWLEGRKKAWGEESDTYRVRILGEFPSVDGQSLIPLEWLEDCKLITDTPHGKLCGPTDGYVIGVDPARKGADSTFVSVRRGRFVLGEYFSQFRGLETTQVAGFAEHLYNELKAISPVNPNTGTLIRPVVCVDAVGIGAGVYGDLKLAGVNVREVQAAALAPDTHPACHRMRDWLYWQLRELFNPENDLDPVILIPGTRNKRGVMVANPEKAKLIEQMIAECSGLRLDYMPGDKITIESKDDYKKRNSGRSPDGSDAMSLSFFRDNRVPRKKVVDIFSRSRERQEAGGWH